MQDIKKKRKKQEFNCNFEVSVMKIRKNYVHFCFDAWAAFLYHLIVLQCLPP